MSGFLLNPHILGGNLATGGDTTFDVVNGKTYAVHTFTSNGTFTPTTNLSVSHLIVAGGGAGGTDRGGGGGGGGVLPGTMALTAQGYSITVGAGGTYSAGDTTKGGNGSNSVFNGVTATGGGGGGSENNGAGEDGGNGGGGAYSSTVGGDGTQGFNGSGGNAAAPPNRISGGGGGGGANGGQNAGGIGALSSISGTSTRYAGGGGGGATNGDSGGSTGPGAGGSGGGGDGGAGSGATSTTRYGIAGTVNTGGGGGGGGGSTATGFDDAHGGDGGSGIVIVRYPLAGGLFSTQYTYSNVTSNITGGTSFTFTGVNIGTDDDGILAVFAGVEVNATSWTDPIITDITLDAASGTNHATTNSLWTGARLDTFGSPAGSTGTIVVTVDVTCLRAGLWICRIPTTTETPASVLSDSELNPNTPSVAFTGVAAGSVGLFYDMMSLGNNAGTVVWTNATEVFDENAGAAGSAHSGAHIADFAGGNVTVTPTPTTSEYTSLIGAFWS